MAETGSGVAVTTTTAGVMSAASLAPLVQWGLTGFHGAPPDGTSLVIAALVIVAVHSAQKLVAAWLAREGIVIPPEPVALHAPVAKAPAPAAAE